MSPTPVSSGSALAVLSGSVSGNTVSVPVTAGGPLGSVGGVALVTANVQPGSFLAFRAATATFNVMTAVCTHEGCTVENYNGTQFVCPCHGSRYSTSGQVTNGPATLPLRSYASTFANETLTFNV